MSCYAVEMRWRNIINFLPSSDIQKLRRQNEQVLQSLTLINGLSTIKTSKEFKLSDHPRETANFLEKEEARAEKKNGNIENTIAAFRASAETATDLLVPTPIQQRKESLSSKLTYKSGLSNPIPNLDREIAFKLTFLYQSEYCAAIKAEEKNLSQCFFWNNNYVEYKIERINFGYLHELLLGRISRWHATIIGHRSPKKQFNTGKEALKASRLLNNKRSIGAVKEGNAVTDFSGNYAPTDDSATENNLEVEINFTIQNESPNKTYVLRGHKFGIIKNSTKRIKGKYITLNVGERMALRNEDIIAIKVNLSTKEIQFGFQFICENQ